MTTAAELNRVRKGRVLDSKERHRALAILGRGLTPNETVRKLKISKSTWQNTMEACPKFRARCEAIYASRMKEVELQAFALALGGAKTVKSIYQARLTRDGEPILDDQGKPELTLVKREVTVTPPDWQVIEFLLRCRMADVYGSKALAFEHTTESLDTIRTILEGKVKELAKAKQPDQQS